MCGNNPLTKSFADSRLNLQAFSYIAMAADLFMSVLRLYDTLFLLVTTPFIRRLLL